MRKWRGPELLIAAVVCCTAFLALAEHHSKPASNFSTLQGPPRNYGVIWKDKLTRSGLPNDNSWRWLRSQGVKSVVTFRTENDVNYNQYGLDVLHMPMGDAPPTDQEAAQFLRFIQDPNHQPVHIHCTAGQSRTGLMAALARYSVDGWPLEQALAEARQYRQGRDLSRRRVQWLRLWAANHPAGSFRLHL